MKKIFFLLRPNMLLLFGLCDSARKKKECVRAHKIFIPFLSYSLSLSLSIILPDWILINKFSFIAEEKKNIFLYCYLVEREWKKGKIDGEKFRADCSRFTTSALLDIQREKCHSHTRVMKQCRDKLKMVYIYFFCSLFVPLAKW